MHSEGIHVTSVAWSMVGGRRWTWVAAVSTFSVKQHSINYKI